MPWPGGWSGSPSSGTRSARPRVATPWASASTPATPTPAGRSWSGWSTGSWQSPAGSTWCMPTTPGTRSTPAPTGTPTSGTARWRPRPWPRWSGRPACRSWWRHRAAARGRARTSPGSASTSDARQPKPVTDDEESSSTPAVRDRLGQKGQQLLRCDAATQSEREHHNVQDGDQHGQHDADDQADLGELVLEAGLLGLVQGDRADDDANQGRNDREDEADDADRLAGVVGRGGGRVGGLIFGHRSTTCRWTLAGRERVPCWPSTQLESEGYRVKSP